MERKTRRTLTGLAAGGVLVGALAGGGVALASGGPGAAGVGATSTTVATAGQGGVTASQAGATAVAAATKHPGRRFARRHPRIVAAGFRAAAADLGLTPKELRAQLRAGKSLAQVAAAKGKSVSGLESAILAATTKVVDAHSGWTAAHKAKLITEIKNHLNAVVNAKYPLGIGQQAATSASGAAASGAVAASA